MKRAAENVSTSEGSLPKMNSSAVIGVMNNSTTNHQFPLGDSNYATVTKFAGNVSVHLRKYIATENGPLPTKKGVTLSPSLWSSLAGIIDTRNIPSRSGEIFVISDSLMVSTEYVNDVAFITLQRYYKQKDFTRTFIPSICVLTTCEWEKLRSISKDITSAAISVMYEQILPELIYQEVKRHLPQPVSDIENCDADLLLTTTLAELLCTHLQENINLVFQCNGCELDLGNQLGHECVYMDLSTRLHCYGTHALTNIKLEKLASEFVTRNVQILNYITEHFLKNLSMPFLIETAKSLYIG